MLYNSCEKLARVFKKSVVTAIAVAATVAAGHSAASDASIDAEFTFPDGRESYVYGTKVYQPADGWTYKCTQEDYCKSDQYKDYEPGTGVSHEYNSVWKKIEKVKQVNVRTEENYPEYSTANVLDYGGHTIVKHKGNIYKCNTKTSAAAFCKSPHYIPGTHAGNLAWEEIDGEYAVGTKGSDIK